MLVGSAQTAVGVMVYMTKKAKSVIVTVPQMVTILSDKSVAISVPNQKKRNVRASAAVSTAGSNALVVPQLTTLDVLDQAFAIKLVLRANLQ